MYNVINHPLHKEVMKMTLKEAKQIRGEFADKQTFSDEELFMFSEAMAN